MKLIRLRDLRRGAVAALSAALIIAALPLAAAADGRGPGDVVDSSVRPVRITATDGRLAARISPVPAIVTDDSNPRGTFRVDNLSTLRADVEIRLANYVIDRHGNPTPAPPDYPYGSAPWYRFAMTTFVLEPGTGREIGFTVEPPADAAAGDHTAALSVFVRPATTATAGRAGVHLRSQLLLQTRLQHRIGGAQPQVPGVLLSADVGWQSVRFEARITNRGNTLLAYQGDPLSRLEIEEQSPWSDGLRVIEFPPHYVPPGAERTVSVHWTDLPLVGAIRATYVVPGLDGLPEVRSSIELLVVNVPLAIVLGVLAVLLAAGAGVVWAYRRRRRPALA